jgi:hypothetical protein
MMDGNDFAAIDRIQAQTAGAKFEQILANADERLHSRAARVASQKG